MERRARESIKGRGAVSNPAGRFESAATESIDDGWGQDPEAERSWSTQLHPEDVRSIISKNDSPDLPFARSVNPYRGCEHGCIYCFARPSHEYWGFSAGLDFETQIVTKDNAAVRLRESLGRRGYRPEVLALGANTDPYQPVERRLRITRSLLEVFSETQHPVSIITKSSGVLRDVELLASMAKRALVRVYVSITTLDPELAHRMEPRASTPRKRLDTVGRLSDAGVPVGVLASPMIPALNDAELESIMEASVARGAQSCGYLLLRLPHGVKALFKAWLEANYPARARHVLNLIRSTQGGSLYRSEFGTRMRGTGPYAALLQRRYEVARRRLGMGRRLPPLSVARFIAPKLHNQADRRQLALFHEPGDGCDVAPLEVGD